MIVQPDWPAPRLAVLPTELVVRYRAVDRELVPAPPEAADTPAHLDALEADIGHNGMRVPLDLSYCASWGALDGNHRIAVAVRLGFPNVPVALHERPAEPRPSHAKDMRPEDLAFIRAVLGDRPDDPR